NILIDLAKGEAKIDMARHISANELKAALKDYPKYQLEEKQFIYQDSPAIAEENTKSWLATYKPILIIFAYITGITLLIEYVRGFFDWHSWMQNFMAGFFLQ
ncbi:MAG: hypothetical protein ABI581_08965, partial [Sediminibacterium sp.]